MDSYQAQDGSNRTSLSLLQRTSFISHPRKRRGDVRNADGHTGSFEALQRPREREATGTTGAESDVSAAEEPLSGLGAS